MEILLISIVIGLIPALIASSKGRSFLGWWIYGAL
ncbi:zinc ribbon domain-containing protein, partial [Salmonella enterica]|nr:zinc ribbon domain-containing protein [Salmonella enterica]